MLHNYHRKAILFPIQDEILVLKYKDQIIHFLENVLLHTRVNFFRLFVWEARRLLSAEASKADASRHYGFYIDGDIAKLPGGI